MGDDTGAKNQLPHYQVFDVSVDVLPQGGSKSFDDDGRLKRTGKFQISYMFGVFFFLGMLLIHCVVHQPAGTVWTASAHIITAVIGSGVLSLAWATAQLGWIAGPAVMLLFSLVTYCTSTLLSACYRSGDRVTGKRNYTYTDAVRTNLGKFL